MDPVIVETKKKGRKPKVARNAPTPAPKVLNEVSGLSKTESIVQNTPTTTPKVLNEVSGLVESVQLEEPIQQPTQPQPTQPQPTQPQPTQPTQVKKQRKVKQDVDNNHVVVEAQRAINTDVVSKGSPGVLAKLKEEKEKEYNEIKELEKELYLEKIRKVVEEDTKLKSIRQLKDNLKSKIEKEKKQKEKLENETKLVKEKEEVELLPKKERNAKEPKKPSQEKVDTKKTSSIQTVSLSNSVAIKSRKDLIKEFGF